MVSSSRSSRTLEGAVPTGRSPVVDRNQKVTLLTKPWKSARGLAWSPDGREVWFTAADEDTQNRALRAVTLKGKERLVFSGVGALTLWDIAADGRVLLTLDEERRAVRAQAPGEDFERDISVLDQSGVSAISRDGGTILGGDRFGIFTRRTDGSSNQQVRTDAFADALAGDGRTLLGTTRDGKLVIFPSDAMDVQPLPRGDIAQYLGAWWFPGDKRVLFTGQRGVEDKRSYVQDVPNGEPRPITPPGDYGVAISSDGKWIAGVAKDGKIPLWSVDSGEQKFVTGAIDDERPVAWSKDGWIWLFRRGEVPAYVYRVNTVTGKREPWKKPLSPPDSTGVFSIVEFVVTPDGNAYAYSYMRVLSGLYLANGLK